MSSPFQKKFSAKDPVKGLTMSRLERKSKREEKEMYKNAASLPQINQGDYDYESEDEQEFPGDDRFTYEKKTQVDSPLDYAYVSTAPHFQRLQDNIARAFTPTKGSKTKAEKEVEFKGETKKVSKKLDKGFEYKPFESSSNYFNETGQ